MNTLKKFRTPQIEHLHSGKVRDSFRINSTTRMIVVTDRISCFDKVLKTPIPHKGAILNAMASFWFHKTQNIIPNHLISLPDPNIALVKEAKPIAVEVIVRGYLTGSMWRYYEQGKRTFSGITVGDGLKKNQKFPKPILTPTTKEESDREITPEEIVSSGLVSREIYEQMEKAALELFKLGSEYLETKDILLVDTKYEFGLVDGKLILIDEMHTPDSSRFWSLQDYKKYPENADSIDKEYVRLWLLQNKKGNEIPSELPESVVLETQRRYLEIFEKVTGQVPSFIYSSENILERMRDNLAKANLIKKGYVAIFMGSAGDKDHVDTIIQHLKPFDLKVDCRVVSAHKNGEDIVAMIEDYNASIEPGVAIAVAGRSNGLGGALAYNLTIPVINCPPFKDKVDLMVNLNSSLMMPSSTPAMTVVDPELAALAAVRCLQLPELKNLLNDKIQEGKMKLRQDDLKMRGRA